MARNKKNNSPRTVMCVILCLILSVCGYIYSTQFNGYFAEKIDNLVVTDGESLIDAQNNLYNDNITLAEDIRISDGSFSFGNPNNPFVGSFDGNGHTVYVDYDGVTECSLFNYIGSAGIVKNTNFVFSDCTVSASTYGAIALISYGTIQDCTVSFERMKIAQSTGYYSSLVAINHGTISHVVVDGTFNASTNDANVVIGPVCAYNYGNVQNVISQPAFSGFNCTNRLNVLENKTKNNSISAVCSFLLGSGSCTNAFAVINTDVYTSDNNKDGLTFARSLDEIFKDETIFSDLDFDNRVWQLTNGKLELIER